MDKILAKTLDEKKDRQIEQLKHTWAEWHRPGLVEIQDGLVFVTIPAGGNHSYMLKIEIPEEFPMKPADYSFVDPDTRNDDDPKCWPSGVSGLHANESPRWICIGGTKDYADHYGGKYDSSLSLAQVVVHIYRQIIGSDAHE